jgi:hypothetical protein
MFSDPLPDSAVSTLRTNETAALAAAMIIAGAFPEIASFAARVASAPRLSPGNQYTGCKVSNETLADYEPPKRARERPKRGNGHVREAPDQCDERLAQAMKANPGASIAALATAIGKSRTSTVTALHQLRDAGLAGSLAACGR